MEPRLVQQQSQKLILSPQIRQYLRLLQLPLTELEQAVDAELAENPLLEEQQDEKEEVSGEAAVEAATADREKNAEELRVGESYNHLDDLDDNFQKMYEYPDFSAQDPRDLEERKNFQEGLITKPEVLSDFLMWQIRFLPLTERQKKIAEEIIGNIDEDGYARASEEEIALACGVTAEEVREVLAKIHELDPPGIGARNLHEALKLQLVKKLKDLKIAEQHDGAANGNGNGNGKVSAHDYEVALAIVADHFTPLEKRDWAGLAKALSTDIEQIKKAVAVIGRLEPRPGRTFYSEESLAVAPDASVSFADDGDEKFKIDIHDEVIPEIRINPYYRRLLRSKDMDEKAKIFLREKMQAALNFLKALKLRKSTIREITEEIAKAQPDFFEKGFSHLKPLRLKDIAYTLGIHESTVSRAIHGKYISTPQGLIPYKSFFSTKLETTDGTMESQKSIMEKIRHVIGKEEPANPLSDQEIVRILTADGLVIARRTVAKYREMLKILPSHLRRKK